MAKKSTQRNIKKKRAAKGGAKALNKSAATIPEVHVLFRKKLKTDIQSRYSESLRKWTEAELGVRLPESYISLIKKRNGGSLRMGAIKLRKRLKGANSNPEMYTFGGIAGIDKKHHEAITALTKISSREWGVPEGLVAFDCDGHWWLCLDYRKCGPNGEPTVVHFDTEFLDFNEDEGGGFHVADSFADLLAGLFFDPQAFVFALDDDELLGESLHKKMVSLGCKGKYPQNATAKDRKNPPESWEWSAYEGDLSESVDLYIYENPLDLWTLQRPAKHPLLLVHVSRKDQQRCISRLAKELGDAAVLIHQPGDRSAVRGIPKPVPYKPPRNSRKSFKFDPKDMNNAIVLDNRALVKSLLDNGADPNKSYLERGTVTPIQMALAQNNTAIFNLLLKYARGPLKLKNEELGISVYFGNLPITKKLIKLGLKPSEKDLGKAVRCRHVAMVRYLMSLGLRPSRKTVRCAAGIVPPSYGDPPTDVNRPILRIFKKAGVEPPDAKLKMIFDAL